VRRGGAGSVGAADEPGGDGRQPQPEPFVFPAAGVAAGKGEQLQPGEQFAGHGDDGAA
jgi:hypothetical protein